MDTTHTAKVTVDSAKDKKMKTRMMTAAAALLLLGGCVGLETAKDNVAPMEVGYATKKCVKLGVQAGTPEWETCLRDKGAARWALKNCGGPFNSTSMWYPSLCAMADDD